MYAIYGNIYHQYTPNVSIYISTMDPMGIQTDSNLAISGTHRHVALRHRDGGDPELMEICQQIRLLVAAVLLQEFGGKHLWHMGSNDMKCGIVWNVGTKVRVNPQCRTTGIQWLCEWCGLV